MSKTGIRWYSTIRIKVVLVVMVSCILVLGSLSVFNTLNEQKIMTEALESLARVTSQRLARHLIGPLWDLDNKLVDSALDAEMLENKIEAIVVWDEGGKRVFSARERGPGGRLVESNGAVSGDFFSARSEVNNGTKAIGEVSVFVSRGELSKQLRQSIITRLITLLALIVVMAVLMTIVMNHIIIGPITRLAKHAADISHGDLKQTIVAESNDEIGQLAEAFNRMQTSLRVAFKRIYAKAKTSS